MKVNEYSKGNGVDKFILDNKVTYVYDAGSDLSISYSLLKLLLNANKNGTDVTAEQIAEYI